MAYDRYGQNSPGTGEYDRPGTDEYGWDYGSGRQGGSSSAREYLAAGELGGDRNAARDYRERERGQREYGRQDYGRGAYGQRDYGDQRYGQNERMRGGGGAFGGGYGRTWGDGDRGREGFTGGSDYYRGGGSGRDWRSERDEGGYGRSARGDDRQRMQGQDRGERGFMERASDEVRSWFGDDEAERRREMDARDTGRGGGHARDDHYHHWRNQQIAAFDRDYDEYRQENRDKFHQEFTSWRTERQGQRDLLSQVSEHMEVVGSDGSHVGTVDKVRGDRIILTKSDPDAGGRHHSIPSRWLQAVEGGRLVLRKTADEAKRHWQDEERQGAMFSGERQQSNEGDARQDGGTNLNRSFSGTY